MKTEEIKLVEKIHFHDIIVPVYYSGDPKTNSTGCLWQMRNPDTCYTGIMYMDNSSGKMRYPEGAVIPEQTDRDREMLPKGFLVGEPTLSPELKKSILEYLDSEYLRRNKMK